MEKSRKREKLNSCCHGVAIVPRTIQRTRLRKTSFTWLITGQEILQMNERTNECSLLNPNHQMFPNQHLGNIHGTIYGAYGYHERGLKIGKASWFDYPCTLFFCKSRYSLQLAENLSWPWWLLNLPPELSKCKQTTDHFKTGSAEGGLFFLNFSFTNPSRTYL